MAIICSRCKTETALVAVMFVPEQIDSTTPLIMNLDYMFCKSCVVLVNCVIDNLIADYSVQTVEAPAMKLTAKNIPPGGGQ